MADRHQRLSHHLWEILDRIGVSESIRLLIVRRGLTFEMLDIVETELIHNPGYSKYRCGSSFEGTTTPDNESDMDMLFIHKLRSDADAGLRLFPISDSNTAPGYVKLQLEYYGTPCDVRTISLNCVPSSNIGFDNAGRTVLNNCIKESMNVLDGWNMVAREIHGPAMRIFVNTLEDPYIDMVYAIPCTSWPHIAKEWLHRERVHNWPPSGMIHMAETTGCLYVGCGHPDSCEVNQEWMFSLSLQERVLMSILNAVQHKCYVTLKFIKSDIIEADIKGDSITSYHLKTCLFYCIERTPDDFWQPDNLVRCLIYCLGTLLHWLRHGYCPNYFIKELNLFRGKLDRHVRERSLRLLDGILSGNCSFLLKIKRSDIGKQLMACLSGRNIDTDAIIVAVLPHVLRIFSVAITQCHNMADRLLIRYLTSSNMDIASCIQSHKTLLHKLDKIKTLWQPETWCPLQDITPHIHTSLACQLVIHFLQTVGPGMIYKSNTTIQDHLLKGLESDLLSDRLKHSAIYYRLADYKTMECILAKAENECRQFMINACSYITGVENAHTRFWIYKPNHPFCDTVTISIDKHLFKQVAFCVRFLHTEIAITPTPLQYEMFRSVGTRPPSPDEQMKVRHDMAAVDAIVFEHCMRYLVCSKMDDKSQKDTCIALEQLESTITTHIDNINHKETSWNILGWIYRQEHDTSNAMKCFKKSMALEPLHNAAKWQIAELCFEKLTNTARLDTAN